MHSAPKTEISKNSLNFFGSFYAKHEKKDSKDEVITSEWSVTEENFTNLKSTCNQNTSSSCTSTNIHSNDIHSNDILSNDILSSNILSSNILSSNSNQVESQHDNFVESEQDYDSNKNSYKSAKLFYDNNMPLETSTMTSKSLLDKNYFSIAHESIFPTENFLKDSQNNSCRNTKSRKSSNNNDNAYSTDYYLDNNRCMNSQDKSSNFLEPSVQNVDDGSDGYDTFDIFGINKPRSSQGYTCVGEARKTNTGTPLKEEHKETLVMVPSTAEDAQYHQSKEDDQLTGGPKGQAKVQRESTADSIQHQVECDPVCDHASDHANHHARDGAEGATGEQSAHSDDAHQNNPTETHTREKHPYDEKKFGYDKFLLKNFFSKISKFISNSNEEEEGGEKYKAKEMGIDDEQLNVPISRRCESLNSYSSLYELNEYFENNEMKNEKENLKNYLEEFDAWEPLPTREEKNKYEMTNKVSDRCKRGESHKNDKVGTSEWADGSETNQRANVQSEYPNTQTENSEKRSEENRSHYDSTKCYPYVRNTDQQNDDSFGDLGGKDMAQGKCHPCANEEEQPYVVHMDNEGIGSEEVKEDVNNGESEKGYHRNDFQNNRHVSLSELKHFPSINYSGKQDESEFLLNKNSLQKYYSILHKLSKKETKTSATPSSVYLSDRNNDGVKRQGNENKDSADAISVGVGSENGAHEKNENGEDRGDGQCRTNDSTQSSVDHDDICMSNDNLDGNSAELPKSNSDVENDFAHNPDVVCEDTLTNNNSYPQYSNGKYAYNKSKQEHSSYSRVRSQKRNPVSYSFRNSSTFNKDCIDVERSDQDDEENDADIEADPDMDANVDSYAECSEDYSGDYSGDCGGDSARGGDITTCIKPCGRMNDTDLDHNDVSGYCPPGEMNTTCNPYVNKRPFKKEMYKNAYDEVYNMNSKYETIDVGIFQGDKLMLNYNKDNIIRDKVPDGECACCVSGVHKGGKHKRAQSMRRKRGNGSDVDEHVHEGYNDNEQDYNRDDHHDERLDDHLDERQRNDLVFCIEPYGRTSGAKFEAPPRKKFNSFNNSNAFDCSRGSCGQSCFQENCCQRDCCRGNCAPDKYHMRYSERVMSGNFSDGGNSVERYLTNVRSDKKAAYSNPFNLNSSIAYNLYRRGSNNYFPQNHYDYVVKENCAKHMMKNYFDAKIKEGRKDDNKSAMIVEQQKKDFNGAFVSMPIINNLNGQKYLAPNDVYYYNRGIGRDGTVGRVAIDSAPAGGGPSRIIMTPSSSAGKGTTSVTAGTAITFGSSPVNAAGCWMNRQKMSVSTNKIEIVRKIDMNYKRRIIDCSPTTMVSNKYMQYYGSNGLGVPSSNYYHDTHAQYNGLYDYSPNNRSVKMPSKTNSLMPVDQNGFSNVRTKIPSEKKHTNLSNYVIDIEVLQENKYGMYNQLNMKNKGRKNMNNFIDLDDVHDSNNCDVYRRCAASASKVVDYDWNKEKFLQKKNALMNFYNDMEEDRAVNSCFPCGKKREQMVNYVIDVDKVYEDDMYMMPYDGVKRRHMGSMMDGANGFRSGSISVAQMERRRRGDKNLTPLHECQRELLQHHHNQHHHNQHHHHNEQQYLHYSSNGNYKLMMEKYNKSLLLNSPMDMSCVNNYSSTREYIMNANGGRSAMGDYAQNEQMRSGSGASKRRKGVARRSLFYNEHPLGRGSHDDEWESEMGGVPGGRVVCGRGGCPGDESDTDENYIDDEHDRNTYRGAHCNDNSRRTKLSKLCRDQRVLFSRRNNGAISRKVPHAEMLHRGGNKLEPFEEDEEESDYYMYNKYGFKKKKKKNKKHQQHLHSRSRGRDYSHHRNTINEDTLCNENELEKITQIENIISRKMKLSKMKRERESNNLDNPEDEDEDSDIYNNIEFDRIKIENILDGTIKLDNKDENIINNILELERRKYTINCIMDKLRKRENECNYLSDMDKHFKQRINSNVYDLYSDKSTYNIYNTKMCVNYFLEEKMHSPENKEFIKNFFVEKTHKNIYFVQVFKKKKKRKEGIPVGKNCAVEEKNSPELGEQVGNARNVEKEGSSSISPPVEMMPFCAAAVGDELAAENEKKYDVEEGAEGKLGEAEKGCGTDGEIPENVVGQMHGDASGQNTNVAETGEGDGEATDPPKSERKMKYFNYQLSFIKWKFGRADKDESKKEDAQQEQQRLEQQAELLALTDPSHAPLENHEHEKMEIRDESFEFSMGKCVDRDEQNGEGKMETEDKEQANVVVTEGEREEALHGELHQHTLHPASGDPSGDGIRPTSKPQGTKNTHPNEDETDDDFEEGDNLIDQMMGMNKDDRDEEEEEGEEKKRETEHSFDSVINEEMVENEENKFGNLPLQEQLFSAMKMTGAQIIMGNEDEDDLDEYDDDDDEDEEEEEEEEDDEEDEEEEEEYEEGDDEMVGGAAVNAKGSYKEKNNEVNEVKDLKDNVEWMKKEAHSAEETNISEADDAHVRKNTCDGDEAAGEHEVEVVKEYNGENQEEKTSHSREVINLQNGETTTPHCSDDGNDVKEIRVKNQAKENIKEEIEIIEEDVNQDMCYSDIKFMIKDKNEEDEEFEEVIEKRSCTKYRNKHNNNSEHYFPYDHRDNVKKEHENYAQYSHHGMINGVTLKKEERGAGDFYSHLENDGEKAEDDEIDESPEYKQFKKQIAMMDMTLQKKEKEDEKKVREKNEQEKQQWDDSNLSIQTKQLMKGTISRGNSNNSISNMNAKNFFIKDMLHENNQYIHDYCDIEDSTKYKMLDIAKKNQIEKIKKKIKKNKKLRKEDFKLLSELLHHKFVLNEISVVGNYEVNYKNCFDILELEEYKLRKDLLKTYCECLSIGLTTHEREFLNEFQLFLPDINIMDDMNILYILRHSRNEKNCVFKCFLGEP
ncbi:hypothetical protein AK88_00849 [Plasmodium fragile]|uniref:Uncharacterized protein n=1 Tax=Plasmodium fragile TaxID=5857 RepID=A0A0D9QTX3_PLAFR|nr:uncharacterized protein AK88_00849 [Plasmodium fragile]KJP89406.1 hypothetical protein AK88_00849 [Plasmodium fragile]